MYPMKILYSRHLLTLNPNGLGAVVNVLCITAFIIIVFFYHTLINVGFAWLPIIYNPLQVSLQHLILMIIVCTSSHRIQTYNACLPICMWLQTRIIFFVGRIGTKYTSGL